jgi:hypothetical protein
MELDHRREMKMLELRHQRMAVANELTQQKNEQLMEIIRRGGSVTFWDPAVSLSDYLEAVEEIEKTGRWKRGDAIQADQKRRDAELGIR